ncbi:hypothetical protein HJC23_005821 [Cyclotella cryptica]|uniref:Uncharacterized protein n=1 Tax=Cyclotella cryptica TaxID=29204 RepID=A0ABD3QZ25_9STRA|eukprot:CCRYP_000312-RA/>CCRYP_000312-RA protein AED:0.23 eAED:0.23 QI:139/1/1/1/0.75/0.6/5/1055/1153
MGVKNLWRLLLPIARRISIQSLSHQTLAIDASIWLTQISKACRDPETGRLLPNRPHVRIFLLRLMRLLFHEIRPVVVFDGPMPEVKRREIQRRRDRREKLWRDDEDDGEGGGVGAVKRTAKKILVQRLKEWRKKEAKLTDFRGEHGNDDDLGMQQSSNLKGGGAFAAGFVPADTKMSNGNSSTHDQSAQSDTEVSATVRNNADKNDEVNDEVISIHSEQDTPQFPIDNNDDDSENDWEMSHAVQSSINDSLAYRQGTTSSTSLHENFETEPHASNEIIASLPTITRSQWIDSQFRAQRIQSRQECIGAAADMNEYSSTQLRNFLKGSRLNKRMNDIGALAGKMATDEVGDGASGGNRCVSSSAVESPSIKVLFGEEHGDNDEHVSDAVPNDDEESGGGFVLPSTDKSPIPQKSVDPENTLDSISLGESDGESNSRENEKCPSVKENEEFYDATELCVRDGVNATTAGENDTIQGYAFASAEEEWVGWGRNDDNIDLEESGKHESKSARELVVASALQVDDDSSSDEDELGTFLTLSNSHRKNTPAAQQSHSNNETDVPKASLPKATDTAEGETESVDWEDGNFNDEESRDEGERREECHSHKASSATDRIPCNELSSKNNDSTCFGNFSTDRPERRESVQSDDEVLWEDGSSPTKDNTQSCNDVDWDDRSIRPPSDSQQVASESLIENPPEEMSSSHCDTSVTKTTQQETTSTQYIDDASDEVSEKVMHVNEFDTPQPENPTIAALQHAQETASRLTSWAGRAVQRAFAAHVEQQKEQKSDERAKLDSADFNHSEKDDTHSPDSTLPNEVTSIPPENSNSRRQIEPFDTSLEGLDAVQRAILQEEKTMERDMSTITEEMKEDILKLLELCGIPWIESPAEAEAQCAALEEIGLVDGIVTEDSDVFVFGGRKVYKNFFNEQQYVEAYYANDAQKELGLGRNQFVSLAMLLGSDYTDGVKGVGIVNGMEIIQAFPTNDIKEGLQGFRDWLDGFGDPIMSDEDADNQCTYLSRQMIFHKKHKSTRTRWIAPADFPSLAIINAYIKPAVDKSNSRFTWAKPRIDDLQLFCSETLGWDEEETSRVVSPVLKVLESKSKQRRLESYFMKYDDGIKFAEVRSKRLKTVLEGIQGGNHYENDAEWTSSGGGKQPLKKRKQG